MRVGSLFSGIGGLDLGLERAGMRVAWQCESDPYCRAVLSRRWPDVPCYEDVSSLGLHELPPRVDLICGGFPCQPVSHAGRRQAQADARWLWPDFARIVRGLRPRFVLVENVPGLLRQGLADVLGDLAGVGFNAEWESLPASAVGAPQLRDRVFILAWRADLADPEVFTERPRLCACEPSSIGRGRSCDCGGTYRAWPVEPDVGRVAYGVPDRVDRLSALGNAVVPAVAEWIGRRIMTSGRR